MARAIAMAAGAAGIGSLFGPEGTLVGAVIGLVFAVLTAKRDRGRI